MISVRRFSEVLLLAMLAACAPEPPPPPPTPPAPVPEPIVVPPFPFAAVWTARTDVVLSSEGDTSIVPRTFTRLEVVGRDTVGLLVRCEVCTPPATGYVALADIVYDPTTPALAAEEGIAEFALAIREAALRRDLAALRPVIAEDFTYSLTGGEGPESALISWEMERYRSIDYLPRLLDQGLATRDSTLWVAPPEFLQDLTYTGRRAGFKRSPEGRWEWVFLVGR
ncbi:MAG TPA: hypothetical protein VFI91_12590 [Longimicrobiaceae bacterium]|nr:hypothetical protein [Longimicrobiaceae bacterium]